MKMGRNQTLNFEWWTVSPFVTLSSINNNNNNNNKNNNFIIIIIIIINSSYKAHNTTIASLCADCVSIN